MHCSAARNYHETMVAHGAHSVLMLVPEDDARCFCVGTPGLEGTGEATKGNPYSVACANIPADDSPLPFKQDGLLHCMDHTMGFAGMVEPLTQFAMGAVAQAARARGADSHATLE